MELLRYLHEKYVVCAASNGPYEQQMSRLKIGGMEGYFDYIFISGKLGVQKPEPAFFEACFDILKKEGKLLL